MRHRLISMGSLTGLIAFAGILSSGASAQTFQVGDGPVAAAPGAAVTVPVYVSGGPADTAALNFTVSASGANLVGQITGSKAPGLDDFSYSDNSITRNGNEEYRGVLYAPTSGAGTINTSGQTHIANLNFTISPSAPDGAQIVLYFARGGNDHGTPAFDTDGMTALIGISNAAGQSIVPGGGDPAQTRPERVSGLVNVEADVDPDPIYEEDFEGQDLAWNFGQEIPPTSLQQRMLFNNENPFRFQITNSNVFGFFTRQNTSATRFQAPEPNYVANVEFTFSTNQANKSVLPQFRIRANSGDNVLSHATNIQSVQGDRSFIPGLGQQATASALLTVYPEMMDGVGPDGFIASFDHLAFGTGFEGIETFLHQVTIDGVAESALPAMSNVWSWNFRDMNMPAPAFTNGFLVEAAGGSNVDFAHTADGLSIDPNGTFSIGADGVGDLDLAQGRFTQLTYPFGWWQGTAPDWVIEGDKAYRVDFTVAAANANLAEAPTFRLRVRMSNDFVAETLVSPVPGQGSLYPAPGDPITYRTYIAFPNDFNGATPTLFFDAYRLNNGAGAVTLQDLTIQSFDHP